MFTPSQLKDYRLRAMKHLLENRADKSAPMLIDYQIDDTLRMLFDLPDRPEGQEPYVGWMTPPSLSSGDSQATSKKGIELIKEFEGFRNDAYLCPSNIWTIGYGHTATAKPGMTITRQQGESLLKRDLQVFEQAVNNLVRASLTQNQFDALVSFAYNVGVGAFSNSSLLKFLNRKHYKLAAKELHRWVRGSNGKLPGLVRRRKAEYSLFMES